MNDQLTSGSILGQTFSLYFARFGLFFGLCGIVLAPLLALQVGSTLWLGTVPGTVDPGTGMPVGFGLSFAIMALSLVLTNVALAAMVYGVFQEVRNQPTTIGECLSIGFARLFSVIGVAFLVGVITLVGTMLCIIPGFIAMVFLAMAVPVVVIERSRVLDALSRSSELGEGHRWTVFGVVFALSLLSGAINALIGFVLPTFSIALWSVAMSFMSIVTTGLYATGITLTYYNLRRVKESIDADAIAEVFS